MKLKTNQKIIAMLAVIALLAGIIMWGCNTEVKAATQLEEAVKLEVVNPKDYKAGDTFSVNIVATADVEVSESSLILNYDNDALECTIQDSTDKPEHLKDLDMYSQSVGHNGGIDKFKLALVAMDPITIKEGTVIVTVTFKVKSEVSGTKALNLVDDNTSEEIATTNVNLVIPTTGITLDKTSLSFERGSSVTDATLVATVTPVNSTDKVVWDSSNDNVATVDQNGKVTAVGNGTAVITATSGNYSARCDVSVTTPLRTITLTSEASSTTVLKGSTLQLKATYSPDDVFPVPTLTWESDDNTIATVDANGAVTGVKEGTATITAKSGNVSATISVTVEERHVTGVQIEGDAERQLFLYDLQGLKLKFTPSDTTDDIQAILATAEWESDNEEVIAFRSAGEMVAVGIGEANVKVTVTLADGSKVSSSTIKVTVPEVHLEGIKIDIDEKDTTLTVGDKLTLAWETVPLRITDDLELEWSSSDETVLKISKYGDIEALKAGKATVKLVANGEYVATVEITVVDKKAEDNTNTLLPATGDIAIGTFAILMVVSLVGIALVVIKRNKRTK